MVKKSTQAETALMFLMHQWHFNHNITLGSLEYVISYGPIGDKQPARKHLSIFNKHTPNFERNVHASSVMESQLTLRTPSVHQWPQKYFTVPKRILRHQ